MPRMPRLITSSSLSCALLAVACAAPASAAMLEAEVTQEILTPDVRGAAAPTWLFVQGAWGRIEIGRDPADTAAGGVAVMSPVAALGGRSEVTGLASQAEPSGDRSRVGYFTPRWMGLQAGASLSPDTGARDDGNGAMAFSLGYRERVGALGVDLAGKFAPAKEADTGAWGLGGRLSLGGFDLGAGYRELGSSRSLTAGEGDRRFDVGLGLSGIGWQLNAGIGLGWARGATTGDGPVGMISLAGGYTPAAGWDLRADLNIVDLRNNQAAAGENRGTGAVVAISSILKF